MNRCIITKMNENELAVPLLRINYKRLEDTVIRQMLFYIRKQESQAG